MATEELIESRWRVSVLGLILFACSSQFSVESLQHHSWLIQCQQVAFLFWIENSMPGAKHKYSNDQIPSASPSFPSVLSPALHLHNIMVDHFVHLLSSEFQLVVCLYCCQIHTQGLSESWARVCSLQARASACSVEAQQLVSHDLRPLVLPSTLTSHF